MATRSAVTAAPAPCVAPSSILSAPVNRVSASRSAATACSTASRSATTEIRRTATVATATVRPRMATPATAHPAPASRHVGTASSTPARPATTATPTVRTAAVRAAIPSRAGCVRRWVRLATSSTSSSTPHCDGIFTTASTQVITGHYTVLPSGETSVLVNGVPASGLNQIARTFSHTVSLSAGEILNPVLVQLIHTPTLTRVQRPSGRGPRRLGCRWRLLAAERRAASQRSRLGFRRAAGRRPCRRSVRHRHSAAAGLGRHFRLLRRRRLPRLLG